MFFSLGVRISSDFDLVGQEIIRFVTNKIGRSQRCAYATDYDERIVVCR
jgi:hypothetical protein